jgi:hypothetical protein
MTSARSFLVVVVAAAGGCTLSAESTSVVEQAASCPIWQCGNNSPEIAGHGFHELHEAGIPNAEGFRIEAFQKLIGGSLATFRVDVTDGRLRGVRRQGTLQGAALVGATLRVRRDANMYLVRISGVYPQPFWAKASGSPQLEAYLLEWAQTTDGINPVATVGWSNVCSKAGMDDTNPDLLGMWGEHSVLFEGDRIDAAAKTVYGFDASWFNIGCAGHALAKMQLTGHTHAAKSAGFVTTPAQRQTILKMFVADYCGTGTPFTVAGVRLSWMDSNGWMAHAPFLTDVEARWSKHGAKCLNTPRVDANPTADSVAAFPDIRGAIATECRRPPPCAESDPHDLDGMHLISANPL